MTTPGTTTRGARSRFPKVPEGDVIASLESYEEARAVVDGLAKQDFPVSTVSILGSHLRTVERVTGRMSFGKAALGAVGTGVMLGLFVGLLVLIVTPGVGFETLIAILPVAIGFSVIWSVIGYAANPQRRQFTSVMQVVATHFDVVVPREHAGKARGLLGTQQAPAAAVPAQQAAVHVPPAAPPAQQPGLDAPAADAASTDAEAAPAAPRRTYSEAQAELRRLEREKRAQQADQGRPGPNGTS
ncbi:pyruvate/2-oxoglutarate dehydrogenase complex dihydrolipoamide acyltransferase (E2) component [Pseudoclavibacter sp. JAI123]|uniref:general stress protein n=1 Tax=Pseudoclavibacter sp. JAI123 TaxID=2723065 RepID=UPI0015C74B7A|nr:general stress protein [Pseudoclavibacter sp. JAI123]NYF13285.1 pyruvate/2-oxoglutarate dehydrogenase complex dihydrolipoamide acyltransferase (E2) component [Pseudoclavibacter sp. JAI123]